MTLPDDTANSKQMFTINAATVDKMEVGHG